jgi:hypothetical protein
MCRLGMRSSGKHCIFFANLNFTRGKLRSILAMATAEEVEFKQLTDMLAAEEKRTDMLVKVTEMRIKVKEAEEKRKAAEAALAEANREVIGEALRTPTHGTSRDSSETSTAKKTTAADATELPVVSEMSIGGRKIESATYSTTAVTISFADGGDDKTGALEEIAKLVTADAIGDRNLTGLAVATFINESFVSIALSQRQIGLLAGLGPNKSNRVGEQRKAGRGSRPSATKVLALIMARKLLTMAGCRGVDELCTYGDHTKEQVEAEGALDAGKIIHTLPHPVTTCPEWTAACKSTLKATVQKNGASSGSFTSANVIKVFWALLAGSQARCPASEAIFNKGVSALESDTKMPLVVKNWLSQSKSQAATVKKEFGFKGQSKRLAADVDVNTSPETTEKKAREEADVLSDNAAASS